MTTAKSALLAVIHFKGTDYVMQNAKKLADDCVCSVGYVKRIAQLIEKHNIITKSK